MEVTISLTEEQAGRLSRLTEIMNRKCGLSETPQEAFREIISLSAEVDSALRFWERFYGIWEDIAPVQQAREGEAENG